MTNFTQKEDAITFSTGNLEMTILNGEETFSLINLNNRLPESDSNGLANATVIPITLKNTGTITIGTYEVKLVTDLNAVSTLNEEYIRFSVSEDNITYSSPSTLITNNNIIYTGTDLETNQTKTLYFKIWIVESASANGCDKTYYGAIKIDLEQQYQPLGPIITNVSDAGFGKITFTVSDSGNGVAEYCVNQNSEDTTSCTWYEAIVGEQTTEENVTETGTYYVHVKDEEGNLGHSSPLEMTITYNLLEYIETTGTQYINTEFNPNPSTTKVEVLFQVTNNSVSTQGVFGSRGLTNNADKTSVNIFFNVSSNKFRVDWLGNTSTSVSVSLNTDINMICENNVVTINGTNYSSTVSKSTSYLSYPIYIGNFNNAGTPYTNGSYSRFKIFKIYDNGTLVRDYLPVERISDGVLGLYDQVENKFYINAGSGTFTKGINVGVL